MSAAVTLKESRSADASPASARIPVIRIINPFNTREFVREEVEWRANKPLSEYFPTVTRQSVVVSINGRIVPDDQFVATYLDHTDNLVVCPVPQGGEDGKAVLRIAAMIAVAYFTVGAGSGWLVGAQGSLTGLAAGSMGAAFVSAGAMVAGSMLINALLPPPKPIKSADSSGAGRTYGIDGAKNTSVEGIPVPVTYGKFRTAGNILNSHMENVGNSQILYLLIAVGEGPTGGVSDIEINDTPIERFKDVEVQVRTGTKDQTVIPWFADTITPINKGVELSTDWAYHITSRDVDQFRLDLVAPYGLFGLNSKGDEYGVHVDIAVEYRKVGDESWASMPMTNEVVSRYWCSITPEGEWYYNKGASGPVTDPTQLAYLHSHYPGAYYPSWSDRSDSVTDVPNNYYLPIYADVIRISDQSRSAVRRALTSPQLEAGAYEIRYRRLSPKSTNGTESDGLFVGDVNEIQLEDLSFPNTALLGLRIRLSEQLNSMPKVTYLNFGRILKAWKKVNDEWQWVDTLSNSPAWIVWDMLTNTRYGAAMTSSRLDFAAFKEWAAYCELKKLTFDGVFDTEMNVWDAVQAVCRCGHGQLVPIGTRYTVVVEKAADPVMMFSVANMTDGTFKETWLPVADRANEVEVSYFDRNDKYKQRTVKAVDDKAQAVSGKQRSSSITLFGVVDHDRAYKEGMLQLNINRYILRTVEFAAPMEAIACTVGDLVYVQHDMPQWGFAGRFDAGSSASEAKLDRTVTLESGKQYKLLAMHDAIMRASGSVSNVAGTSIFLTGFDGVANVKRIQVAGKDMKVVGTFNQGDGTYGVVVDNASGIASGMTYELWDTDVLEERDVVNAIAGTTDTLTFQSPFSVAPRQFANWMFGEVNKVKKPFRIKSISGGHEYRRDITALEYNESVYDLDGIAIPTPNYSSLDQSVQHVTIDNVTESLFLAGGAYRTKVTVYFSSSQSTYGSANVFAAVNGRPYEKIADSAFDRASIELSDGDLVTFKVVARDAMGAAAADSTAPTRTHTVLGKAAPPAAVRNFKVTARLNDLLLTWDAVPDGDLAGYEVRVGASWDDGAEVTKDFLGTMITHVQLTEGTYYYHIRAYDSGGRPSDAVTTAKLTLSAPAPVSQFDCVQSGTRLEFRWKANPELNILGYEIREGVTWSTSQLVTLINSTTYTMPAGSAGSRTFWIKAIVSPGIYSKQPAFTHTEIAQPSNVNLVHVTKEHETGFAGVKHYASIVNGELTMDPGAPRSEYMFNVDLPISYRAQNSVFGVVDSVSSSSVELTWREATFSWTSPAANRQWIEDGSLMSVAARFQIAPFVGAQPGEIDGWRFDDSTGSVKNIYPTQSLGVTYGPGRYGNGVLLKDTTKLEYPMNIPSLFNQIFWIRPQEAVEDCIYWTISGGTTRLSVGYSKRRGGFYLEDQAGRVIVLPFTFGIDDRICIGVAQASKVRKLFAGKMGGNAPQMATALHQEQGGYTKLQLY